MKANIGSIDRVVRIIVGMALVGLTLNGNIGVWGWIGVVPVVTAFISFCPLYAMLGMSTCSVAPKS